MQKYEVILVDLESIEWSTRRVGYPILKNFTVEELACPTSGILKADVRFLQRLQKLRDLCEHAISLNSCCRSQDENEKVGGHYRSLHLMDNPYWNTLGTIACDVSIRGWSFEKIERFKTLAYSLGFSLGIAKTFIHLDLRVLIGLSQITFTY